MRGLFGMVAAVSLLTAGQGLAAADKQDISGLWQTVGAKSHVRIDKCSADTYCGKIVWLKEPLNDAGTPVKDIHNRNGTLRDRDILGIDILSGLEQVGEGRWDDGNIYNPEDGNTYGSELSLNEDGSLAVKGCVLFFCKEQVWTRVE
ncbi:DUF2147 domain-containing protein [Sneathiella chinensis]|uniref:DUF2147 domain-containing protein n=1 Tax=Sneathiella chinensis TaxID=349750 RepID=A0ABQ5U6L9_9PROT|nr:DUF2147 domain-containing protein [Sneathiella chinensis]GLQ07041.1 hypothetical protein GCM10007924_22620 [Sneathiella chinensis]